MHTHSLDRLTHAHAFLGERHDENERRTWIVVGLTLAMMVAEIAGGAAFGRHHVEKAADRIGAGHLPAPRRLAGSVWLISRCSGST